MVGRGWLSMGRGRELIGGDGGSRTWVLVLGGAEIAGRSCLRAVDFEVHPAKISARVFRIGFLMGRRFGAGKVFASGKRVFRI